MTETLIKVDLAQSPYDNAQIHNRWHPDIPMAVWVKPGDDFFAYAEGTWLKTYQIPADKSRAGYNYELPDEIELQVRKMVEDVSANPSTPIEHKIADAYNAWMDEAGIEARGLAPLKPYIERIDAVADRKTLVKLMAHIAHL